MRFLLLTLALTAAGSAIAEETFPGIEQLMSPEQFRAAGLDKLTPAERAALDAWLVNYTAVEAPAMLRDNQAVQEAEQAHEINTTIRQPFRGWSGETVFYLDNGQVWRQRLSGNLAYYGDDTKVVIRKNFLGFYKMTHLATGKSVGVSRVK
jgi:hypothetical protein